MIMDNCSWIGGDKEVNEKVQVNGERRTEVTGNLSRKTHGIYMFSYIPL